MSLSYRYKFTIIDNSRSTIFDTIQFSSRIVKGSIIPLNFEPYYVVEIRENPYAFVPPRLYLEPCTPEIVDLME